MKAKPAIANASRVGHRGHILNDRRLVYALLRQTDFCAGSGCFMSKLD
jgi:hypothetical protein